ncbi:MAG TPA: protein kinase, partial [Planctomycetota bacterium]|nr:protein kinase [Planctomycetota bacterium]
TASEVPPQLGAYRVNREIGRGGMAVVYEAEDLRTGTRVAIKVLKAGSALDKSNLSRFYSEIEALQKLDHPNIVRVHGVGEAAGHHFYAMQFIDGRGLDRMVNECKQDLRRTAAWIRDIAHALESAHDRGIVHRDVKPGNILVDREGRAYLTDFGLALRDRAVRVTMSGTTLGTPNFMSPEQARGERNKLDRRTDVYSLGATLYNLTTGRVPYWENTPELVVQKILNEDPKLPTTLNLSIDRSLQTIMLKAMDKEPTRRYASAAEMGDDLQRWLAGEPIQATPSTSGLKNFKKWWGRHRRTILIAGTSAAAASLVAGLLFLRQLSVTESIAGELTRAEEERERYRQSRKPPIARYTQDRDDAVKRATQRIEATSDDFESDLKRTLVSVQILNQKEKSPPAEAAKRVQMANVGNRREFANALYDLGELNMKSGDYAAAVTYLKKAEATYRDVAAFAKGVADSTVRAQLTSDNVFKDIISVEPQLNNLDDWIARCESFEVWMRWLADKDANSAIHAINEVVRQHSGRAEPLVRRGLIHVRAGNPLQAAADFSNVLLKDPKHFGARLGQVELRLRQGDLSEAYIELSKLPETRRRYGPEVAFLDGLRLMRLGNPKDALAVFEQKEPDAMPDIIAARAACLLALSKQEKSEKLAEKLVEKAEKLAAKAEELQRDLEDRIYLDFARLTGRPDLPYEIWSTVAKANHALRRINEARAAARLARDLRPDDQEMNDIIQGKIYK